MGQDLLECLGDSGLYQKVSCYTRVRENQEPSLLDLILTNEDDMIQDVVSRPPLGKSDHVLLEFNLHCYTNVDEAHTKKFQYDKGDYDKMKEELASVDWETTLKDRSIDEMWCYIRDRVNDLVQKHIPRKEVKTGKIHKPLWMTYKALKAVKRKYNSWKKYTRTSQNTDYEEYKQCRNQATKEIRRARKNFEKKLSENLKEDTKSFWGYTNSGVKVKIPVGELERQDGTVASNDQEKADVLNDFFTSVFTEEDQSHIPRLEERHGGNLMEDLVITEAKVLKKLKMLKTNKSPGPDMCHPCVLSRLREELVTPLTMLYQKSLSTGELPEEWKTANVTALYKKQSRKKPCNYRPISLTCIPCKILESLIKDKIMEHMSSYDLFSKEQHGFRPGRSCITQLLEVMETWTEILDEGGTVDAIYFDFAKAFDTVPRERLLGKCEAYGMNGDMLKWIRSFLSGRKQRVAVNGCFSSWSDVTSGIPQGSVLGPVLFVMYINDLPDEVRSSVKIFADDTKAFRNVTSDDDIVELQNDINALCEWSEKWKLSFNADKCSHMTYGRKKINSSYTMKMSDGTRMKIKNDAEVEKDLGVTFDRGLMFRQHIGLIVKKVNRLIALVRKTFKYMDCHLFRLIYTALIRPHFDYADCIWSPHFQTDIAQLENAQRRATRLVPELLVLTYEERLQKLNLPSLVYRRRRMDMIQTFRILKGVDNMNSTDFFELSERQSRGHSLKLVKKKSHLNIRKYTFSNRIFDQWNALPNAVVDSPDVTSFKVALDAAWAITRFSVNV